MVTSTGRLRRQQEVVANSESEYSRVVEASLLSLEQEPLVRAEAPENSSYQVIDLFCGAGGMSAGFAAVGAVTGKFRVVVGVDVDPHSAASYRENIGAPALVADLREWASDPSSMAEALAGVEGYTRGAPTVLIGCAPCQGYSAHRKKDRGPEDGRNSLVADFADIAATLRPDVVVMENVPELLASRYRSNFEYFVEVLEGVGYRIDAAIENAAGYGVPQARKRALVVASLSSHELTPPPWLSKKEFRTVRNAISGLAPVAAGVASEGDSMHRSAAHRDSTLDVIRQVPPDGGSRPHGVGPECLDRVAGFYDVYGRLAWDRPAITITHYARNPASGRYVHPEQDRGLTAREAARLQGFPDWYVFRGGFDDVFRQIGEAVPPAVGIAVGASILARFSWDFDAEIDELDVQRRGPSCTVTKRAPL